MQKGLKILATLVLLISSLYFGVSLFLNQLIAVDVVDTVVSSEVVEDTIMRSLGDFQEVTGVNDSDWDQFMTLLENDETFNDMTKSYIQTLLNDMMNNENTFDDQEIKTQLLSMSDVIYELSHPSMTKEEFQTRYENMINSVDMKSVHDQAVSTVQTKMSPTILKPVQTVYHMANMTYSYLAIALMIIATGYLGFVSYQNKRISKGISATYLTSGILMFMMAIVFVFALSAVVSGTTSFQISSIKYMYICGGIYIAIAFICFLINLILKRKYQDII